jgi:hypothetical protein
MFKPLANPESLIIICNFSYLLTKSDQFGDTVMLAPESHMTSNGDPLGISLLYRMGACNAIRRVAGFVGAFNSKHSMFTCTTIFWMA